MRNDAKSVWHVLNTQKSLGFLPSLTTAFLPAHLPSLLRKAMSEIVVGLSIEFFLIPLLIISSSECKLFFATHPLSSCHLYYQRSIYSWRKIILK